MCFCIARNKKWKTKKKARKPIKVFKIFNSYSTNDCLLISPYKGFKYEAGETYYEDSMQGEADIRVNVGIHSYSSKKEAIDNMDDDYLHQVIVACTIPKGAYYYYNPGFKQYVSDTLKIGKKALVLKHMQLF